jgi:hypothetical protein
MNPAAIKEAQLAQPDVYQFPDYVNAARVDPTHWKRPAYQPYVRSVEE